MGITLSSRFNRSKLRKLSSQKSAAARGYQTFNQATSPKSKPCQNVADALRGRLGWWLDGWWRTRAEGETFTSQDGRAGRRGVDSQKGAARSGLRSASSPGQQAPANDWIPLGDRPGLPDGSGQPSTRPFSRLPPPPRATVLRAECPEQKKPKLSGEGNKPTSSGRGIKGHLAVLGECHLYSVGIWQLSAGKRSFTQAPEGRQDVALGASPRSRKQDRSSPRGAKEVRAHRHFDGRWQCPGSVRCAASLGLRIGGGADSWGSHPRLQDAVPPGL